MLNISYVGIIHFLMHVQASNLALKFLCLKKHSEYIKSQVERNF